MILLTVTERGQVTIRKEVLKHLGIKPGDKIELDLLPERKFVLQAPKRKGTIDDFVGSLAGKNKKLQPLKRLKTRLRKAGQA
jgi:antitoxin PrlF